MDASENRQRPRLPLPYRTVLLAAALFVAWHLMLQLTVLLLAVVLAVIIALPLDVAAGWLRRRTGLPRGIGAPVVMLGAVAVVGAVAWLIVPRFVMEAQDFVSELPGILRSLPGDVVPPAEQFQITYFLQGLLDEPMRLLGRVADVLTTLLTLVGGVLLVLFAAVYMAINPQPLVRGLVRLFPVRAQRRAEATLGRLRGAWLGWLRGVAVDAVLTGILTYAVLSLIGLRFALIFAVVTGLLEVIPYIGPVLAAVPPVLYALTQSVELALLTLAVFVVVQQLEGHLIVPLVMAETVSLHPALLSFGVVLIGAFFGFMGLLLAVPLLSAIVILVQELWVAPNELRAGRSGARPVTEADVAHQL